MYVIIAYDINVERVNRAKAFLRMYLTWVQNSLFEGEITESDYMEIKKGLSEIIKLEEDSVVFYLFSSNKLFTRETMGKKKGEPKEVVL
ncbi:MAG: CRISPR-associated endonuclease Cas2 [Candidatus Micrarchaeia archaeon]